MHTNSTFYRRKSAGSDDGIMSQVKDGFRRPLKETMKEHRTLDLDDEWTKRMEVGKRELLFLSTAAGASPRSMKESPEEEEGGGWMEESTEDDQRGRVGTGFPWDSKP